MMMMMMVMMMMMMMQIEGKETNCSASVDVLPVSAVRGKEVVLPSVQQGRRMEVGSDVKWIHNNQRLLKKNKTTCEHGRCDLQSDGSLRFKHPLPEDAGNYNLNVFDKGGKCLQKKHFLLIVEDVNININSSNISSSSSSSSSSSGLLSSLFICFLLTFLLIIFILRKRRSRRMRTAGPTEENVYMMMHSYHGNNKKKDCDDVPCDAAVSKETPITQQPSEDAEDIYV